jgi:hypothetical protein
LIVTPFIGCSNIQELNLARTYATESNGSDTLIAHTGDISSSLKTINFFGTTATILYENYFIACLILQMSLILETGF